jgi:hypothetical protein
MQRFRRVPREWSEDICAENNFDFLQYEVVPLPQAAKPDFSSGLRNDWIALCGAMPAVVAGSSLSCARRVGRGKQSRRHGRHEAWP